MALFGREREVAQAIEIVDRLIDGRGGLCLIAGEPGIGKSTLAGYLAKVAVERGARVAWGRAWEAGGAPSLWPWLEVFRELGLPDEVLGTHDGEGQEARFRLFDRAAKKLRERAEEGPTLVVLDDLHAADEPTLMLLLMVAQRLRSVPLTVVGTHRDAEARAESGKAALFAKIAREGETLALRRLDREAIVAWVDASPGETSTDDVEALWSLTEGNPLFVKEALALGPGGLSARLRAGLSAILDERLSRLSEPCRELLGAVSVVGRDADRRLVERVTNLSLDALQAHAMEGERTGVLVPGSADRLRFSHVLLRDRLYASVPASQRAELHWKVGRALRDAKGAGLSAAHHLLEGHMAGELDEALGVTAEAALRARGALAFEDAIALAERAMALLPDATDERAVDFRLLRAEALMHAGASEEARRECLAVLAPDAPPIPWPTRARAALTYAHELGSGTVDPQMVELLERVHADAPEGDHPLRIRVAARLSMALVPPRSQEDRERVDRLARESLAAAERLGDPEVLLYVLRFATIFNRSVDERWTNIARTYELAVTLNRRDMLVGTASSYLATLVEQGKRAEARAVVEAYASLLADFPEQRHGWRLAMARATLALLEGDVELMLRQNAEALRLSAQSEANNVGVGAAVQRWVFACLLQDPTVMGDALSQARQFVQRIPHMSKALEPWFMWAEGRGDEAREQLREVLADPGFRMMASGFPGLAILGEVALAIGERESSEWLYAGMVDFETRWPFFFPGTNGAPLGPTALTLARHALVLGRRDDALRHLDRAVVDARRTGSPVVIEAVDRVRRSVGSVSLPVLEREGKVWAVRPVDGPAFHLKPSKGLSYLKMLMDQAGSEVHVLELVGADTGPSDAGPVLDAEARSAYRERVVTLRADLEEAERHADLGRAEKAQAELDALAAELARAVGLGGRERRAGSHVERARVNVQRCIQAAIARIRQDCPELGRELAGAVTTGTFCSFRRNEDEGK